MGFALVGAVAALIGYVLSLLVGWDLGAPGWLIVASGAVGGFIGGTIRKKRGKK
ncbi:hypothetical protein [Roseovarius sp. THAF8]|uniref:hypothetical protein n=1 Tax=Roseovarius sp. THAF8 TaxID=2587846 RepID=UPI0015628627|nr:hypothetical protein [Roseovarius sp. THAF8]